MNQHEPRFSNLQLLNHFHSPIITSAVFEGSIAHPPLASLGAKVRSVLDPILFPMFRSEIIIGSGWGFGIFPVEKFIASDHVYCPSLPDPPHLYPADLP